MTRTTGQPSRSFVRAAGVLLAVGLVLVASLNCVMHWLVVDAARLPTVVLVNQSPVLRAQHAAEVWSAAPCTCEMQQAPMPTHAEPQAPAIVLLATAIVIAAVWTRGRTLSPLTILPRGVGVVPATPPPQA